ncbi:C40 family peptidase [Desulforapulum autotrophicum]|nr:C40 family peptidase [Desulforapulum autotrophicum]
MVITVQGSQATDFEGRTASSLSSLNLTARQFEQKVKKYLGIPYLRGGTSRKGMDCSSFVRTVYSKFFGINLPYTAGAQFDSSKFKKISTHEIQPGDLIFFATNKRKRISHVGMYVSDGQFIHASSSLGITMSSLDDRYWKKRFVGSKRHKALNIFQPDFDQYQLEGSLTIPVNQNGEIQILAGNDFRFNNLALENDFNPVDDTAFESHDVNVLLLPFYEIDYGHTLFDGLDMHLSAIHEKFDLLTTNSQTPGALPDTAERMGIKLSGDFWPGNGFNIKPSITYFDYSKENETLLNVPEWSFGLNTLLSPIHKQWALYMQLEYSKGEELASNTSSHSAFSSMDMEIKLRINLRDNLEFSITGQHDIQNSADEASDDSLLMQSGSSNVLMMFNCFY